MYRPHLASKFNLRRLRMEIDLKNGAVLVSMVLEQFEKIISKNNIIFSKSFSSKKTSYRCIPVIVAAAAAAAATKKYNNQDSTKVKNKQNIREKNRN